MPDTDTSQKVVILGVTSGGRTFRPSDWAERLAGVMSQFRPKGGFSQGRHIGYSPWCVPTTHGSAKCVVVHTALREHEPMAWDFVMAFARDNDLQVLCGDSANKPQNNPPPAPAPPDGKAKPA